MFSERRFRMWLAAALLGYDPTCAGAGVASWPTPRSAEQAAAVDAEFQLQ